MSQSPQPQPSPLNAPPFRIEHPDAPGVVFAVGFTTENARSVVDMLNSNTPGFVIVRNEAGASAVAMPPDATHQGPKCPFAVEDFVRDVHTGRIHRVAAITKRHGAPLIMHLDLDQGSDVAHHPVPETAFEYFEKTDRESYDLQRADLAEAARLAAAPAPAPAPVEPAPPAAIVCPFKVGDVVQDKHSLNGGAVTFVFGDGMNINLGQVDHFVPAANYGDYQESTHDKICSDVAKARAASDKAKAAVLKKEATARQDDERKQAAAKSTEAAASAKSRKARRSANSAKHSKPNRAALLKNKPATPVT